MNQRLAIYRCPEHRQFWAVILDEEDGGGLRLTPSKCCGRWHLVKSWRMSARELRRAAEEFTRAASKAEAHTPAEGHPV